MMKPAARGEFNVELRREINALLNFNALLSTHKQVLLTAWKATKHEPILSKNFASRIGLKLGVDASCEVKLNTLSATRSGNSTPYIKVQRWRRLLIVESLQKVNPV